MIAQDAQRSGRKVLWLACKRLLHSQRQWGVGFTSSRLSWKLSVQVCRTRLTLDICSLEQCRICFVTLLLEHWCCAKTESKQTIMMVVTGICWRGMSLRFCNLRTEIAEGEVTEKAIPPEFSGSLLDISIQLSPNTDLAWEWWRLYNFILITAEGHLIHHQMTMD